MKLSLKVKPKLQAGKDKPTAIETSLGPGGMTQVVQCLASMHQALVQSPSTTKYKKTFMISTFVWEK